MKILISNIITAIVTIAISYSIIMASVDNRLRRQKTPEVIYDDKQEESDRVEYVNSDKQVIQNFMNRINKLERFVDDISPMMSIAMKEYDKMKTKEENIKVSNNYFKEDLETYSSDVQKKYKDADRKSQRYLKDKQYDKCVESIQEGINALNKKDGYVYGIAQHRLTWCLYKSGRQGEARKQLEELLTGNEIGQFSNGVKVAVKAKVDLYRLCMSDRDYDCAEMLENELVDIGSEKYTSKKTVDQTVRKIKSGYN
jgi:hypothetical protein